MSLATILAALAAMAVNFGWQKADDGYEYLVQLEPETVQLLNEGVDVPIDSHVPESVQPIRKIRIVVGKAELPRESLSDEEPRTDERVERTTFFRPGDTAPAANERYPQPPASPPPSTLDTIVQPIRDVDDFFERGFEASVDGLEKTGNAIRGSVDNTANTVQDHWQRGKDLIVGPSADSAYRGVSPTGAAPPGTAAPPAVASAPGWPNNTAAASASGNTGSIPGLPPPPALTGTEPPAVITPVPTPGPSGWDNRVAAPATSSVENDGRMVPIETNNTATTAPEIPSWKPNAWPTIPASPSTNPDWLTNSAPANSTPPSSIPAQPVGTNGTPPSEPAPKVVAEKPVSEDNVESNDAKSLGSWGVAIVGLIASISGNFFLGFNYLDIRNKYRAALRRTSRGFSRPAESA